MAEDGGVEPHPISENPVFKAGRRTNPAASSSIFFGRGYKNRTCTKRFKVSCATTTQIPNKKLKFLKNNKKPLELLGLGVVEF